MKGLYLYCIRAKTDSKFSTEGIDRGRVSIFPYQDLEAVVSQVDLKKFGSDEIQRRAREDLKWIKEKALVHEKVIEKAMKAKKEILAVIPMKFGTIFKTKKKLLEALKKHYAKFQKTLADLKGMQEWGVKVYLARQAFEEEVKKASSVVKEKEKLIAAMPEGTAYFMQAQIDDEIKKEADKVLKNYTEVFFKTLSEYSRTAARGKILAGELTGQPLPMVLNGIFLVSEEKLKDFKKEINRLSKDYKEKGFTFEYSGPWPPYNFI